MKKLIALFAIAGCLTFGMSNVVMAQEQNAPANDAEQVDAEEEDEAAAAEAATTEEEVVEVSKPFNQVLKDKFRSDRLTISLKKSFVFQVLLEFQIF